MFLHTSCVHAVRVFWFRRLQTAFELAHVKKWTMFILMINFHAFTIKELIVFLLTSLYERLPNHLHLLSTSFFVKKLRLLQERILLLIGINHKLVCLMLELCGFQDLIVSKTYFDSEAVIFVIKKLYIGFFLGFGNLKFLLTFMYPSKLHLQLLLLA